MRVCIVDSTISGELIGGAQLFLAGFVKAMVDRQYNVDLVTDGVPNKIVRETIYESGAVVHSDLWRDSSLVNDSAPIFAKWVNEVQPDLFVISVSADMGWVVLPVLKQSIATVTVGHNDEETFYAPVRHYHRFLTRAVGVSEVICRNYVDSCHMPPDRVDWIPYGVETRPAEPEQFDGPLRLIYVGRFEEEQKRISDVVAIAKRLSATDINYEFTMVGDGEAMPMVRSELAREIASGKVRLTGWLDGEEVIRRMNESEIFILASAYEGFCISLTEAMANGCCPIVTDIRSGNNQLIKNEENGFIVPIGATDAFVDRIGFLANNRGRLLEMRRAAWETGKEYGVDRMVESYERCFEQAIENARSAPRQPEPDFPLMPSCRSKYPLWLRRIKAKAKSLVG